MILKQTLQLQTYKLHVHILILRCFIWAVIVNMEKYIKVGVPKNAPLCI